MIPIALVLLLTAFEQLPEPFATPWYRNITRIVPQPDGQELQVPPGFEVNVFADGLQHSRMSSRTEGGRGGGAEVYLRRFIPSRALGWFG